MFQAGAVALAVLAANSVAISSPPFSPVVAQMDYVGLVEREGASVAHIAVRNPPKAQSGVSPSHGFGTGFFVSEDGYLVTNAHVVADALSLRVRLADKRDYPARIVGLDRVTDVALLKIEARGLQVIRAAAPEAVRIGEPVGAIGSPFNYEHTVTGGIVSAKGRNVDDLFVPFIQTDTAINPGNSGGPLFNSRGEVIGINSRIWGRSGAFAGMAFAIPIELAMRVAAGLRANGYFAHGQVEVMTQPMTPELASAMGIPQARGAIVTDLGTTAAAFDAGLRVSDLIVRAGGAEVEHPLDLARAASPVPPGERIPVEILRDGVRHTVTLPVSALGGKPSAVARQRSAADSSSVLGLAVRPLSTDEQARLPGVRGLMVERVVQNSPAALAELVPGDVVLSAHGAGAVSLDQIGKTLQAHSPVALLVQRGSRRLFVALVPEAGGTF